MAAYFKMESFSGPERITFHAVQARLIKAVNGRIQNGEFSERGLAKLIGISQPQIHNVLKGARKLGLELADRLLFALGLTLFDLFDDKELAEQCQMRHVAVSNTRFTDSAFSFFGDVSTPKKFPASQQQTFRGRAHGGGAR
jgi:plasmid maintenance system antidote protein VapI